MTNGTAETVIPVRVPDAGGAGARRAHQDTTEAYTELMAALRGVGVHMSALCPAEPPPAGKHARHLGSVSIPAARELTRTLKAVRP
ncbi:hypothetical protein RND61_10565 [Streptomyces sp. TRM76323]|uniref:Uncharacterized protein n=1 Tax=Streptomyces tamarix TaxID=3078565 RepID=A0ABU3QIE2_9ACTN|nr:hypothetical protein [Streptomyces tamarix]MDT9682509.1 hypothetical protein [Streptomyces tamarix]